MSDEPRTPTEWDEAVRVVLEALLRPGQPVQHKHGLAGTNPYTRSTQHNPEGDIGDVLDGRETGGAQAFGINTYEDKMKEWHETGVSPWQAPENTVLPVDGRKLRRRLRRYRREELLTRHLITRRPWEAWKTLRYGADYWREW